MRGKGRALCLPLAAVPLLLLIVTLIADRVQASPIQVPDLTQCQAAVATAPVGPPITLSFNCCLPITSQIVDFSFEKYPSPMKHLRRPAHKVKADYIAKYNKAYELMRALPDSDPRSLKVQADIHCSFCNGGYKQVGASGVPLQVHFSWLFLPWHRWYLYFHERILGSLLGDPSFSLVFWNWDDQSNGGNVMPPMFVQNNTALYDSKRNQDHLPPFLVRLSATSTATNDTVVANQNLNSMYQSIVTASTAELFMGGAYRTGTDLTNATVVNAPLGGGLENGVHNGIHFWTGDPDTTLLQDMGNFLTASRDPIFYAHHSNVDRLWDVWRFNLPGGERFDHTDPDFLNTEFLFYDENANLVKVNVKDSLDNEKLGVSYKSVQKTDDTWINYNPPPITSTSAVPAAKASGVPFVGPSPLNGTIELGTTFAAIVKRPTGKKPSKSLEVLQIQGVELMRDEFVALVAFVNLPFANASTATDSAEYLGTFNIIPTSTQRRHLLTTVKYEIGDNLKRIGLRKEEEVVISLVVKESNTTITIQGLQIVYE